METVIRKKATRVRTQTKVVSIKDRIKPRGLAGCMKGKIHYDEDADIFNLKPLPND